MTKSTHPSPPGFSPVEPNFDDILSIPDEFNIIPVIKKIKGDMDTPISIFSLFRNEKIAFFFESAEGAGKWGRYSYICINPALTIKLKNGVITTEKLDNGHIVYSEKYDLKNIGDQDIFNFLKSKISSYKLYSDNLPSSLTGGLFGYLGYEICGLIEKLPPVKKDVTDVDDLFFMIPGEIIIHDSLNQDIIIASFLNINHSDIESTRHNFNESLNKIEGIISSIRENKGNLYGKNDYSAKDIKVEDEVDFDDFRSRVLKAKEYILEGDIFQVQVSRRKKIINPPDPFLFYRALRFVNPSPYMFYLKINDYVITGSSPENLVKLSGNYIETRPIAGTIKRGEDSTQDEVLAEKLLNDPKERAEHIMLVDLGRNDIGRVSKLGTVKVERLMYIEKYSHVQHIVTSVVSEIVDEMDGFDLIRASYPAGTVSGAPKVRAMEIINELEDSKRGVYAGGVGYFGFLEDNKCKKMEFCITIRTALFSDDAAYIQAAGGIVFDSTPENEFNETENKLRHLIAAFNIAETFN